jgi:hypothetical protein
MLWDYIHSMFNDCTRCAKNRQTGLPLYPPKNGKKAILLPDFYGMIRWLCLDPKGSGFPYLYNFQED